MMCQKQADTVVEFISVQISPTKSQEILQFNLVFKGYFEFDNSIRAFLTHQNLAFLTYEDKKDKIYFDRMTILFIAVLIIERLISKV